MMKENRDLENSRSFWSRRYGQELTMREVEELQGNFTGLFNLLIHLDGQASSGSWATSGASGL